MTVRGDPATDAFLHLMDVLDAEANAVAHAVVRAKAAVVLMVEDSGQLLEGPTDDRRAWTEVAVRLLQHHSSLVEALASLRRPGAEAVIDIPVLVVGVPIPVPPSPQCRPAGSGARCDETPVSPPGRRPLVRIPAAPTPRYHLPQLPRAARTSSG